MDLPTCPACGQSVIDDDAVHCPFCDAPMSGKPTATSPQPAPAKQAPAPGDAPTPSGGGAKAAAAPDKTSDAASGTDDADPFDIDSTVGKNVIPIRPNPSKGRSVKVVCPMCDTPGYISRKAAGRDVRCCNSNCMVPVFTAPASHSDERPVVEDVGESSGQSKAVIGGIVGVAVVLVAGLGWFFLSGNKSQDINGQLGTGPSMLNGSDKTGQQDDGSDNTNTKQTNVVQQPRETPLSELKVPAIKQMVNAAREKKNNRSKAFCRQMCAESFAYFGDAQRLSEQLQQLVKVGPRQRYYQIRPQTVVAWRQLQDGDEVAARQWADRAWSVASDLPNFGRVPLDLATALAAVLVRLDRVDDAKRLIADHNSSKEDGQLSAAIEMRRGYEFAKQGLPLRRSLTSWNEPQSVAVTVVLAAHGHFDLARDWARQTSVGTTRDECLQIWAQCVAHAASANKKPELLEMLAPVAGEMDAAGRARLYAGVATLQLDCGDQQRAAQSLKSAADALESLKLPAVLKMPDTRGILNLKLPDLVPLVSAAVAATEVSRAHALSKNEEAAWQALTKAIQFCAGIAPPRFEVNEQVQLVQQSGDLLASQLQMELSLDNADKGRVAARNYRKAIQNIAAASARSFQLQVQLLQQATGWGMHKRIWDIIGDSATDDSQRSPLMYTSLPFFVRAEFVRNGDADTAKQIVQAVRSLRQKRIPQPQDDLELTARVYVANKKLREAAQMLEADQDVNDEWKQRLCLDLIDSVMRTESVEAAQTFVQALKNPLWRELLLAEITAIATRNGQGTAMWKFAHEAKLAPTELVTVYRSLLIGISQLPAPTETPAAPEAANSKQPAQ